MPSNTTTKRIVEMKFKNKDFEKKAKQSMNTLDQLEEKLKFEGVEEGVKRIDKVLGQIDVSKLDKALDSINYRLSNTGIATAKILGNVIDGLSSKLNNLFTIIKTKGEARARNIENATFSMRSLFGETKKGLKMVQDMMADGGPVRNAVAGTRFGLDEAAGAAAMFAAAGVESGEKMESVLKSVAGVATVTNRSFADISDVLGDMATRGYASGDTLSRLAERNFNLTKDLQEALGKTAEEITNMARKREISADTVFEVLQKYADASQKANDTYDGAYENLKAALGRMSVEVETNWRETKRKVFVDLIRMIDNFTYSMKKGVATLNSFISGLGEMVQSLLQNDYLIASIMTAFGSLNNIGKSMIMVFSQLADVLFGWIPFDFIEVIHVAGLAMYTFAGILAAVVEANQDKIHTFFEIIMTPLAILGSLFLKVAGIVWKAVTMIVTGIMWIGSSLKSAFDAIGNTGLFSALGNLFLSIWDGLAPARDLLKSFGKALLGLFKKILPSSDDVLSFLTFLTDKINALATYGGSALEFLGNELKTFFGLFSKFKMPKFDISGDSITGKIVGFAKGVKEVLKGIGDAIAEIFGMGHVKAAGLGGVEEQVAPATTALERFQSVLETIKPYLEDFGKTAEKVTPIILSLLRIFVAKQFADSYKTTAEGIASVGKGLSSMFKSIGGSFDALGERIKNFGKETNSDIFRKIAMSILMLAIAFRLIATLDWKQIALGSAVMVGFFVAMGAMMFAASKMKASSAAKFKVIGKGLMEIGAAIALMAVALKLISTIVDDQGTLLKSLGAFVVMTLAVIGMITTFGLLFKTGVFDSAAILAVGGSIMMISAAMIILAGALFLLSKMEFKAMAKGLKVMGLALLEFGAALLILGKSAGMFAARNYISIGIAILAISAAMNLLVPALVALSVIPMDMIFKSLIELGTALAQMSIALAGISMFGKGDYVAIGAGLLFMAVALDALVPALLLLAPIPGGLIAKSLIEVGAALAGMSLALGLLSSATSGLNAMGVGVALIAVATSLNLIVPPLVALSLIPWDVLKQGVAILAGSLAVILFILGALAGINAMSGGGVEVAGAAIAAVAASVWILTKSLAAMAGVLALLTALDTAKMLEAAKALTLIIVAMGAILFIGGALPGFSLSMLAVGVAFATFALSAILAVKAIDMLIDVFERIANMDPSTITKFADNFRLLVDEIEKSVPSVVKLIETIFKAIVDIMVKQKTIIAEAGVKILIFFLKTIKKNIDKVVDLGGQIIVKFLEGLNRWIPKIVDSATELIVNFIEALDKMATDIIEAGTNLIVNVINGIADSFEEIGKAADNLVDTFIDAFLSPTNMEKIGEAGFNAVAGLVTGIGNGIKNVWDAGVEAASNLIDAVTTTLDEHSPSKKMLKLGNFAAEGFRLGVVQYDRIINNTGAKLGNALLSGLQKVVGYGKGRKYAKYLDSISKTVKDFIKSQKITDASGMGNHLYLKSSEYKENVKQLKDYYKQYNETYKKSEKDLAISRSLSGDKAKQAHEDYEQDLKDLKEIDKAIIKMGRTIAQGPAKAIAQFRKELKQTIKDSLSLSKIDLTKKNLDIFTNLKTSSKLSNANNLLAGLKGTLNQVTEAAKATSDQFNLLNISYETGMDLLERFTKVSSKSAQRMFTNARSQLRAYEEFQAGIQKMRDMGFDESLVSSLAAKGYKEALGDVRSFQKFSADQVGEYNGLVEKQHEYEREELKKNVEETEERYSEHMDRIEELAARGLHEGIIRRLKSDGLGKEAFVKALWSMDEDYIDTFNDYYLDSVDAMNDVQQATNDAADSYKSFGEMVAGQLSRQATWNSLLEQLTSKGVSKDIIKYFKDAGYDSAHVMAESLATETPRAIEEINSKWAEYADAESKQSALNWAMQIEDSNKVAKEYTQNMKTLASLLPEGRKNPIYQKVSELGIADGNEYAEAFIEADSATRERIQKAFNKEQKANADLMLSQLKDRLAKTKEWAANLKKIADETYKKSGDGHKKGDHIIGADLYNELVALGPDAADMIQDIANMSHKQLAEFSKTYSVDLDGVVKSSENTVTKGYKEVAETAVTSFKDHMKKTETVDEIKEAVNNAIVEAAKENKKKAKEKGEVVGEAGSKGFKTEMAKGGEDGARNLYDGWTKEVDDQISKGKWSEGNPLVKGIDILKNTLAKHFESHSPSRFTKRHAKWFAEGWEVGIHKNKDKFTDSTIELAESAKSAFASVNDAIQNDLYNRTLDYRIDVVTPSTPLNLDTSLAQASQIQDIFSSISGVNFEIGRDANKDVVTAINDMRSDFENQIDKLSAAINDMQLIMDTGALVGQIVNPMDQALGQNRALAQRGVLA